MNKYLTNFLLFCILPLALAIGIDAIKRKIERIEKKRVLKEGHYAVKGVVEEQKPFVFIVCSYNNEHYVVQNLSSLLSQDYQNYRIIYVDDVSNDNTLKIAKELVQNARAEHKVRFVKNKTNIGALANIYYAATSCNEDEIIVLCDGDDWVFHNQVLSQLNAYYANSNIWLTWGNYKEFPSHCSGVCMPTTKKILSEGRARTQPWGFSHLKTFYASLFNKIKKEDLMHEGSFYSTCSDLAIMFPMLEMAREHAYFIKEVLYIYNHQNPINEDKVKEKEQKEMDRAIRHKSIYQPLASL